MECDKIIYFTNPIIASNVLCIIIAVDMVSKQPKVTQTSIEIMR
jgi:hypothetical protein